jgi:hypothetical protein
MRRKTATSVGSNHHFYGAPYGSTEVPDLSPSDWGPTSNGRNRKYLLDIVKDFRWFGREHCASDS